jgi:hypothetical protein
MNQGDLAIEQKNVSAAAQHYSLARTMVPDNTEMTFWSAVGLASNGRVDDAIPLFKQTFTSDPAWMEMTRRMVAPGLLPKEAAERVLREATKR